MSRGARILDPEPGPEGAATGARPGMAAVRKLHLVGVAGSGLSALARLCVARGMEVSGSELQDSPALEALRCGGIRCFAGHAAANVPEGVELVVISAAVVEDNPEVVAARKRGIPVLKYAQCLGRLMAERKGIAIAGTHGKTTTTAMVASVLAEAGRDPGFLIGGEYPGLGGSSRWAQGELFVAEACEFDRSFLNLHPHHAVVTNIEEDHLDYFKSIEEIQQAFAQFVGRVAAAGSVVLNADDPYSRPCAQASAAAVGWFSLRAGEGDWWAEEMGPSAGGIRFRARSARGGSARIALRVPGVHNVKNALATLLLLERAGLQVEAIAAGLEKFTGVRRRFEVLKRDPVVVIDDYAHHPTEIEAVLRAARETFGGRRIRLIFQPHQHSRTRQFLEKFAQILAAADEAVVAEVYRARDSAEEVRKVNAEALVKAIQGLGGHAVGAPSFDAILGHLRATLREGEVLICAGAGDITTLARRIADGVAAGGQVA